MIKQGNSQFESGDSNSPEDPEIVKGLLVQAIKESYRSDWVGFNKEIVRKGWKTLMKEAEDLFDVQEFAASLEFQDAIKEGLRTAIVGCYSGTYPWQTVERIRELTDFLIDKEYLKSKEFADLIEEGTLAHISGGRPYAAGQFGSEFLEPEKLTNVLESKEAHEAALAGFFRADSLYEAWSLVENFGIPSSVTHSESARSKIVPLVAAEVENTGLLSGIKSRDIFPESFLFAPEVISSAIEEIAGFNGLIDFWKKNNVHNPEHTKEEIDQLIKRRDRVRAFFSFKLSDLPK